MHAWATECIPGVVVCDTALEAHATPRTLLVATGKLGIRYTVAVLATSVLIDVLGYVAADFVIFKRSKCTAKPTTVSERATIRVIRSN